VEFRPRFEPLKAIEVLLHITKSCPDMYNALKVLYFADKDHLAKYGRLICGDRYVAMSHGPVPSGVYDLIKIARGDWPIATDHPVRDALKVDGYTLVPMRPPKRELLSDSEIQCLDASIEEYGNLPFGRLKAISHTDPAFKAADENDFIPMEALVKSLPDGEALWDYLVSD